MTTIVNDAYDNWRVAADAVTVAGTGLTTIATIESKGKTLLCFHFDVETKAVDDFDVLIKAHEDAQSQDVTPSDWTSLTAGERFLYASGDLTSVAADSNGYFEMDIAGLAQVIVKASAASDSASVTPRWSLR